MQTCAHTHTRAHTCCPAHTLLPTDRAGGLHGAKKPQRDPRLPAEQGWNEGSQEGCQQKEAPRGARPCNGLVAIRSSPVPHVTGDPGTRDPGEQQSDDPGGLTPISSPRLLARHPQLWPPVSMSVK